MPGSPTPPRASTQAWPSQSKARSTARSQSGSPTGTQTSTHTGSSGVTRTAPPPDDRRTTEIPAASARARSTTASGCVEPRTRDGAGHPADGHGPPVRVGGDGRPRAVQRGAVTDPVLHPPRSRVGHGFAPSSGCRRRWTSGRQLLTRNGWSTEIGSSSPRWRPRRGPGAGPGAGVPPVWTGAPSRPRGAGDPPCGCCTAGRRPPRSPRYAGRPCSGGSRGRDSRPPTRSTGSGRRPGRRPSCRFTATR